MRGFIGIPRELRRIMDRAYLSDLSPHALSNGRTRTNWRWRGVVGGRTAEMNGFKRVSTANARPHLRPRAPMMKIHTVAAGGGSCVLTAGVSASVPTAPARVEVGGHRHNATYRLAAPQLLRLKTWRTRLSVRRGRDATEYKSRRRRWSAPDTLGMTKVLIHPFSGVLSAYGVSPMSASCANRPSRPYSARMDLREQGIGDAKIAVNSNYIVDFGDVRRQVAVRGVNGATALS